MFRVDVPVPRVPTPVAARANESLPVNPGFAAYSKVVRSTILTVPCRGGVTIFVRCIVPGMDSADVQEPPERTSNSPLIFWPNGAKLPMIWQLSALANVDDARPAIAI